MRDGAVIIIFIFSIFPFHPLEDGRTLSLIVLRFQRRFSAPPEVTVFIFPPVG